MQVFRTKSALTQAMAAWQEEQVSCGFVPTMGALHKGHLSLVTLAKTQASRVVVSIFVNPTQFGPGEDFTQYPRDEEADTSLLEKAGVDAVYLPRVEDIYPGGQQITHHAAPELANMLCGLSRPGHFDGVVTVVARLLEQVQPNKAFFGEKDYQQFVILREMAERLSLSVQIIGAPIIREADGLALSSRNRYLTSQERIIAPKLYHVLEKTRKMLEAGKSFAAMQQNAIESLLSSGFSMVEYLSLHEAKSLKPLESATSTARLFAAARLGKTRLIDNVEVQHSQRVSHQATRLIP